MIGYSAKAQGNNSSSPLLRRPLILRGRSRKWSTYTHGMLPLQLTLPLSSCSALQEAKLKDPLLLSVQLSNTRIHPPARLRKIHPKASWDSVLDKHV